MSIIIYILINILYIIKIEIKEDVMSECEKFGNILSMKIPRPTENKELSNVGKVQYENNIHNIYIKYLLII